MRRPNTMTELRRLRLLEAIELLDAFGVGTNLLVRLDTELAFALRLRWRGLGFTRLRMSLLILLCWLSRSYVWIDKPTRMATRRDSDPAPAVRTPECLWPAAWLSWRWRAVRVGGR